MNPSMSDTKAWKEVVPDYVNKAQDRSAENLLKAAKQFEVATNPRYVKGHDGVASNGIETYCNVYLWDVTIALDCEIPHWVDLSTGVKAAMGKGAELSANGVCKWLSTHGLDYDWMQCGENMARARASKGFPTVAVWQNASGIGHVAIVLPSFKETRIAQAGGVNFFDDVITKGFGSYKPLFYTHD